jgi:hypothetical protein
MVDEVRVIEDGVDSDGRRSRPISSWVLLAVGFALGLGFGVVFVTPTGTQEPTADQPSLDVPISEGKRDAPTATGIAEIVTGFGDVLVAVAETNLGTLDHLTWPRDGPLVRRPMIDGDNVGVDASGQVLALTQAVPGLDGVVLSVGRFNSIGPLASGVTSFAWHDSRGGVIAYTTETEGVWQLWKVLPNLRPQLVVGGVVEGGRLAVWGDWGWAVQTKDSGVLLLNPGGEIKGIHPGTAYSSHSDGWIVVAGDSVQLLSAGGGVRDAGVSVDAVGEIRDAAISPSGDLLAMAGTDGVIVVPIGADQGESVRRFAGSVAESVTWTSDERFVIITGQRGVHVLDIESRTRHNVLVEYKILATATIPGPTS